MYQRYFYNVNGLHKKDFADLKSSIFEIRFTREKGTWEERSVILEMTAQSHHITQL